MLELLIVPHVAVPLLYDFVVRRAPKRPLPDCAPKVKKVSVIIPVRNDQVHLKKKLEELCGESKIPIEIIIMDSSDEALKALPHCKSEVKYYHLRVRGKVKALNEAIRVSSGDVLLFTDVDAHGITPELILNMLTNLCNEVGLITPKVVYKIRDHKVEWIERGYFERAVELSVAESEVWSATVFTGSFMMIRKSDLLKLGGFPENVGADDTFLAHRVSLILGKRAVWVKRERIIEHIDEGFIGYLKKKVRRAQHLQQAFLSSTRLLPRGRGPKSYKIMIMVRFYLNLINPFIGLLGYLGSINTPLFLPLTMAMIALPQGRLWSLNQLALIFGLFKNLYGRNIAWK